MENASPIVEIRNLFKSYRRGDQTIPVLQDITFDITDGEFLALMGPSGSGKSTLLNLIAGIDEPDSGLIKVGGTDITTLAETDLARWRALNVGFIFQFYNLMPVLTAFENVELPLLLTSLTRNERREHVEMALEVVSLTDRMDHYPAQLSGGQQQRVAIARCLAMEPAVMLLDEPTSALDPTMTSEVLASIRRLAAEGMTMVIVTHELEFARSVASRVWFMSAGRIYESGTAEEVIERPSRDKTVAFINRMLSFSYAIESRDYDGFALQAQLETFCEQHFFGKQLTNQVHLAVEEGLALYFSLPDHHRIELRVSFSEREGRVRVVFEDPNPPEDFLRSAKSEDGFELAILESIVEEMGCERTPTGNKLTLLLRSGLRNEADA